MKQLLGIVQNQYPERLDRALLLNTPGIFYAAWKVISPLLDKQTRDKVFFIDKADTTATLQQFMGLLFARQCPLRPSETGAS